MRPTVQIQPMDKDAFSKFGDLLETSGAPDKLINEGRCGRFHDLATLDFSSGRAGISLFKAEISALPFRLRMLERHPAGSQAFLPMCAAPFLVIVAPDQNGAPGHPLAFRTKPGQGVNYHRNVWHGVLTPLGGSGIFGVVDRIGAGANLEEHWFDTPYSVVD